MLSVNEGMTSLWWHIDDRRGKIIDKQCVGKREMNLADMLCIDEERGKLLIMCIGKLERSEEMLQIVKYGE
jgi:hypothetical protein